MYVWITTEYLALSRDRDYYKRKFDKLKKLAEAGQEINEIWNKYKHLRNKVNILNKKLKRDFLIYRGTIGSLYYQRMNNNEED